MGAFAEYWKNTLTGSYGMKFYIDPTSDSATIRANIFHETIHRIEDTVGEFDGVVDFKPYDERNAEYMQLMVEGIGSKLMAIENGAKNGVDEAILLKKINEMHAQYNSFKKNELYFPSTSDMKKWFGFSFNLNEIEENYINNSKYPVLRKLFAANRLNAVPTVSKLSKKGYWVLADISLNASETVNDDNIKADPYIKSTSYKIYPGGGSMTTLRKYGDQESTYSSSHSFSVSSTLIPDQNSIITLGVQDSGTTNKIGQTHMTGATIAIIQNNNWYTQQWDGQNKQAIIRK